MSAKAHDGRDRGSRVKKREAKHERAQGTVTGEGVKTEA